ncbi:MAG: helix-turn-helix transcriptional regulator [Clostridia bacterium]|nr:helix-turn-helix transcriptional regulator [Clostridia bacterium]
MDNEIKTIVANNLIALRKRKKITQTDVAHALNYSDKSISKWENADSLPDISVLCALSDMYGVTLDDLTHENAVEKLKAQDTMKVNTPNRLIIACLSIAVIFLIASLVFVYVMIKVGAVYWQAFVWGVPISCVALLYLDRKWSGIKVFRPLLLSILCISLLISVYLQFMQYQLWLIFVLILPIEVIIVLSSKLHK